MDEYAVIDLGKVLPVDAIAISYWRGSERQYGYRLFSSEDGIEYTPLLTNLTSGTTEDYELNTFERRNMRFIKYVSEGNSANTNSNITEFAVLKVK